jgi:hypothetical protein
MRIIGGVALSSAVIGELRREIEALEVERASLTARIDAIRRVLGEEPSPASVSTPTLFSHLPTQGGAPTVKAVVRQVLQQNPGVKAGDVTRILRERGYHPGGHTRLSHRVYNEIWRMAQSGEVERTEDGGFIVA